jgi:mannose-6-phosphate isomerase-like protein (cupin superfamily)
VKILIVKPKQMLSLQKHKKRKEVWYFLTSGYVQIGKNKKRIEKGRIVRIGKGKAHRLISKNKEVRVLEIAFGSFSQKDIIRLEDKYGRIKK